MSDISRREFLKKSGMAAAALAVLPDALLDAAGKPVPAAGSFKAPKAATDKLNILGVGIGGRGSGDLREMETENIIGLCDVDWKYAGHVFDRYPKAKRFNDYRKMFDKMLDKADAVMVATADHTHAIIAADAIAAGKHCVSVIIELFILCFSIHIFHIGMLFCITIEKIHQDGVLSTH